MKKEVSPELYNYNKFPGPAFARVGDKVVSENIELDLLLDHKDAFDQTAFGQRFSQIMLKFDYIVGDWGNEQLRLKGFYKDGRSVASNLKISRLDDYLLEYCNFGCAYFILGNENPQDLPEEKEEAGRKRKRTRRSNRKPLRERTDKLVKNSSSKSRQQKQERQKRQDKKKANREIQEAKRGFVIRQKQR